MYDKIINNKKLLIAIGFVILVALLVVLFFPPKKQSATPVQEEYDDGEELTDSTNAINDLEMEMDIVSKNPILGILPINNDYPFYIIDSYYTVKDRKLIPGIEITYKTDEGKAAADSRLNSSDLSKYNPSNYTITYTKIDE